MGFAKYLEDNISIYNNNMYMRGNSIPKRIYETSKATPVVDFRHVKEGERSTHVESIIVYPLSRTARVFSDPSKQAAAPTFNSVLLPLVLSRDILL